MRRLCKAVAVFLITAALVGCTAPAAKTESKTQPKVETKTANETLDAKLQSYFRQFYAENDKYTHKGSGYLGLTAHAYVDGYFKGNELKRMTFSFLTDEGSEEYQCYFIDKNDIFIVRNVTEIEKIDGKKSDDPTDIKKRYSEQYFMVNDKLMTYIKGKTEPVEDQDIEIDGEVEMARRKIMELVNC